jgi:ribosomal protein L11 methyltransferase
MIELRCPIHEDYVQPLEDYFCELTRSPWMLFHEGPGKPHFVMGYFDDKDEADKAWLILRKAFKKLPEAYEATTLAEKDWKEAYKEHLKPWQQGRLHWVPAWMRQTYSVPSDAAVVWFDAGLAFGTGDHPTTRLCAIRLMDYLSQHPAAKVSVVDAGCGSGILALSAAKLGCGSVAGFDRDPESVRVSIANREDNGILSDKVLFYHAGLEEGFNLTGPAEVVLANIISDVLCIYADDLIHAVKPGGVLALSGILAPEQTKVKEHFEAKCTTIWGGVKSDGRIMGEWSDVALFRP